MHYFLLEIVNSIQIVSAVFVLKIQSLFTIIPCLIKTILSPPLAFLSFLKGGNWYPSILNWASGKLLSNLVLLLHAISIGALLIFYTELKTCS